jgi:hypothetical protein
MPDLQQEREHLAQADRQIAEGRRRVTVQVALIARLAQEEQDTTEAWRLCVDAPSDSRGVGEICARRFRCCRVSGLSMQPSSRLRACMGIADRVQIALARSRRLDVHWFSRPRLLTVAPYLSTDLPCLPDASGRGGHAVAGAL